jgi:regulator of protease activity HflC (stomatin/prohibitin superfamily)
MAGLIVLAVVALFFIFVAARTVRIIPQARAGIIERLGRYSRTTEPGLTIIVPFVDRLKPLIDLREQVVSFPPQPAITEDNVTVHIDSVLYFTITDPKAVTYEVASPLQAIEQLTVTTLRNVIGGMTLEETLTSRDQINAALRVVLDEATGQWGIRVNRVEIKSIDPPGSIQEAMEKQMRAERDRRAAILNAEGVKQSQILTAEGEKTSAVLRAEGAKEAAILRAEGESKAIGTVFAAIHEGKPDQELLSYQYLQMLPQLARGEANKIFVIPSEFTQALGNIGGAITGLAHGADGPPPPATAALGGPTGSRAEADGRCDSPSRSFPSSRSPSSSTRSSLRTGSASTAATARTRPTTRTCGLCSARRPRAPSASSWLPESRT